jgi:hypothetical protein
MGVNVANTVSFAMTSTESVPHRDSASVYRADSAPAHSVVQI